MLIDEQGRGSSVIARTDDYLPVVIMGEHELWQRVRVKITAAAPTHLYGVIDSGHGKLNRGYRIEVF